MGGYFSKKETVRTSNQGQTTINKSKPTKRSVANQKKCILSDCTYKNTKPFVPPITRGKVIKVYDGDTLHVASEVWQGQVYRFSVRMKGYDSAEMRTRNAAEKRAALIAKDALVQKVMNKMVTLKNVGLEKYGRVLCDVYLGNQSINQWMIDNHYGVVYDGGTKTIVDWSKHIRQYHNYVGGDGSDGSCGADGGPVQKHS